MLKPTREEWKAARERGKVAPLRRRVPADLETPVSAYLKLRGMPEALRARFLLESVERGIQVGRYSFIGVSPASTLRLDGDRVHIARADTEVTIPLNGRDPLSFVRDEIKRTPALDDADIPGPFAGAVGYISYEVARFFERLPLPEDPGLALPGYYFMIPHALVVFDHVRSEMEVVVLPDPGDPDAAYDRAQATVESLLAALSSPLPLVNGPRSRARHATPESNMTRETFERHVRTAKEHILAGDAFQIVVSQRFAARTETEPFQIYRALRILNPSPYMFFFDAGDFQMIGSSPEVLVKLEKRKATLSPIAGTRPRGTHRRRRPGARRGTAEGREGARRARDAGGPRAQRRGARVRDRSVKPESLMLVEQYSHVMHIVSNVAGTLAPRARRLRPVARVLPGGHGHRRAQDPRHGDHRRARADARGPYAGALGYFGYQGNMDMCITIRTIVMRATDSTCRRGPASSPTRTPTREYEETRQQGARADAGRRRMRGGEVTSAPALIDNYDSFTYNLVQYLGELGDEVRVVRNDAHRRRARARPCAPRRIVISPGPGRPDDAGVSKALIAHFAGRIPILGVCLGHQCIGEVFGGEVVRAERVMHGKDSPIHHDGRAIFAGSPTPSRPPATTRSSIERAQSPRPPRGLRLHRRGRDHGRAPPQRMPVEGVQFHPESILTAGGHVKLLLANFLGLARDHARDTAVGMMPRPSWRRLLRRERTSTDDARRRAAHANVIVSGESATPAQIAGVLIALRAKGETVDEIAGLRVGAARQGDPRDTARAGWSTPAAPAATAPTRSTSPPRAAFVAAAAGVAVAKHGNRAISSQCGSADVLEALGVQSTVAPRARGATSSTRRHRLHVRAGAPSRA